MDINITREDTTLTVALDGRLDTLTAPQLEDKQEDSIEGVEKLVFDLEKLQYISSAGLRVLLSAMQIMEEQGELKVRNARPEVMDVFEVTGFIDYLSFE
ncbi:STAS domain-containing protein [Ruminococcus sp.]|uniref:STAS domain-containing protein n=1 Tax=Ruminococcus sp. TaxID=41978 RepID=UPI0025FA34AA|nr:STAS domain-containing protein [Ruminococcus sp.]MBQ8967169.1 STAS domain-containing protein [Ruminococcus sp.]